MSKTHEYRYDIVETLKVKKYNINNAEKFSWGEACKGWWFKRGGDFSVILEEMPPSTSETKHYHKKCEQFFLCLEGHLFIEISNKRIRLDKQDGISVPAEISHRVFNNSLEKVRFLVISSKDIIKDRVDTHE